MAVIYLRHKIHGQKVASTDVEAKADRENGWEDFDPNVKEDAPKVEQAPPTTVPPVVTEPVVPAFLAGAQTPPPAPATGAVVSDLPEDFPGREPLIAAGYATWASVTDLDRNGLIALKGIGEKTADAILKVMEG